MAAIGMLRLAARARLRRCRRRIVRLEAWHRIYDDTMRLQEGDRAAAIVAADGSHEHDPLAQAREEFAGLVEMHNELTASREQLKRRVVQLERMNAELKKVVKDVAAPPGHVRVLVPTEHVTAQIDSRVTPFPVVSRSEEVVLTPQDLRTMAEMKLRERQLREGVMSAFLVPPLITDEYAREIRKRLGAA